MKKYPVISQNNNEYFVDVYEYEGWHDSVVVGIYQYQETKTWFGIGRAKRKLIKIADISTIAGLDEENYEDYRKDFVLAAKESVRRYEEGVARKKRKQIEHENMTKNRQEKFEQWDGRC